MKKLVVGLMVAVVAMLGLTSPAHATPSGDPAYPSDNGTGGNGNGTPDPGTGNPGTGNPGTGNPGTGNPNEPTVPQPGVSVPRLILTGFTTTPAEVVAGQDFDVSFTLKNTSRKTRVQNIKVTLSSGEGAAFLPASGSSSIFIERISVGDESIQTMRFHSLPSLEEQPYQLTLAMEYEDNLANPYQAQESVAVQVKQTVRADTSAAQVMPPAIGVGQDASVTFNIHNQGKTKLYNAKAIVKPDQGVTASEVFVGTIDAGASGAVEFMIHADAETTAPLQVQVSYEDVEGKVTVLDKQIELAVIPMQQPMEQPMEPMPMEEPTPFPWLYVAIGAAALLALIVVSVLVRRSRRRRREQEDLASLSMLGGDPLVPTDAR